MQSASPRAEKTATTVGRRRRVTVGLVAATAVVCGALAVAAAPADASSPYHPTLLPILSDGGGVVFSPNSATAYVTDASAHEVQVIDTAARTLITSIPVGGYPSGIAITPNGATVVVTNQGDDTISIISTATKTVTSTVGVGQFPTSVGITPDGTQAYVVDLGDGIDRGDLRVIDLSSASIASTTPLGVNPQGVAFTPDGSRAVIANAGPSGTTTPGTLSVIDTSTAQVASTIQVGVTPDAVAISPDGSTAYASNYTSDSLSVVNLGSSTQTAAVAVGSGPDGVAVSPDGAHVYVADAGVEYQNNGAVSVVSSQTDAVTATITVGGSALDVAASPNGRFVYATNNNGTLAAIDNATIAWNPTTTRISGADRYTTAALVAKAAFPNTAPIAFVATGTNFPDALSAAAAAAKKQGPLLLTAPNSLPTATADELSSLKPKLIVLVGGPIAVSSALQAQLSTLANGWGGSVTRDAGADRYATGRLIVSKSFSSASRVFIATGANFPDALSASAAAGAAGIPVVLVDGQETTLDAPTKDLLTQLGASEFDVVGGPAAVSTGLSDSLAKLGTVQRFSGADRYQTSALIDATAFPSPSQAFYATGGTFPDALAGAVLAAVRDAPLAVIPPTCVPNPTADDLADAGVRSVTLLGGPNALSPQLTTQPICG